MAVAVRKIDPTVPARVMLTLYSCTCLSFVPLGIATLHRIGPRKALFLHENPATIAANLHAKALVTDANWLTFSLFVVSALATAWWSSRIVAQATAAGMYAPHPLRATYGWLVPGAWWFVGFHELCRISRTMYLEPRPIRIWQGAFAAACLFGILSRGGEDSADRFEIITVLRGQGWMRLADAAVFAIVTALAANATRGLHRALAAAPPTAERSSTLPRSPKLSFWSRSDHQ
jgi:hypothetical protein